MGAIHKRCLKFAMGENMDLSKFADRWKELSTFGREMLKINKKILTSFMNGNP